ncbi:coiled-coil domain-containing protein 30 isoform X2 [Electrophorus electricus]|uniref:coiled-coil domain-containing protein 30 isoform X2 n=1 Tax=Electrophorus electricus TaxID=8005 RepID=UPI0015D0457D|nr:coiled-coil domain-containing protein 30 isoform X2 [Electrophorus electricus]
MDQREEKEELQELLARLQGDGVAPEASAEERQQHLWRLLQRSEGSLAAGAEELRVLRSQQASEMNEVENYVEHIRNMLEERECLTAEYERDNEQLRAELTQMKHQQECQSKEVLEMLEQEGLAEIIHSSASEQVAYLLVERVTLLERLEAAERKLDTQTLTGNLREVHLQEELDHIRHTLEEEIRQQRETMQQTKESVNKGQESPAQSPWRKLFGVRRATQREQSLAPAQSEELEQERTEKRTLERDLEEASSRLAMAHKEIRSLTDELDVVRKTQAACGPDLQTTGEEVAQLRQEVEKLKRCDMVELQRAKERNERLDTEIRALRDRVRSLDAERKTLLKMIENFKIHSNHEGTLTTQHNSAHFIQVDGNDNKPEVSDRTLNDEQDQLHKRCRRDSEDKDCRLRELQRRLHKQQQEHEELVERNEELEALLGEAQNKAKEEREQHECEVEGLHRKIKNLELNEKSAQRLAENCDGSQPQMNAGVQERLTFLESRLAEEKNWRKKLEVDLAVAQSSLNKEKQAVLREQAELMRLRVEVQSLQAACQQGKSLNKSLAQVKGEKGILEEKVAQLERARIRLQDDLAEQTDNSRVQEDLRESRQQVTQLTALVQQLRSELSTLEKEHSTLRDELMEKSREAMELQAELSASARELQRRAQDQLDTHNSAGQERAPDPDPRSPTAEQDGLHQAECVRTEMSKLHTTLEEERQLTSQHQLALQAQICEAQARAKAQDFILQQKGEEHKQLKQDLQRTQHLFTSAERELRYEREKNLDLKRHNALLDQEKIKLCAELKQSQARAAQLEASAAGQAAEVEQLQQRVRELELELARSSQSGQTCSSLREELSAERARVISADKKVLELQQQLKNTLHQLRLEKARAGETSKLERDTRDMSDNLYTLRAKLQEERLQRKLVEQRDEELEQQVVSLRTKEATLAHANSELSHRSQQLETRLEVLENELSSVREQQSLSQRSTYKLEEQLVATQHESEKLQEELQQVLQQLDGSIRRYNEKQCLHKTKLRNAKQLFTKATTQRDMRIQKLENDLALATILQEKEKDWIRTVTEENEQLLLERRELLERITEAEEMGSNGMRTATTTQQRVKFLEMENKQLQDKTLKLANQIGVLERALRNLQSVGSPEDVKKIFPSGTHPDGLLRTSTTSPSPGLCDSWGLLDVIRRVKVGEHAKSLESSLSLLNPQPSEIGYLNVNSPMVPNVTLDQEETHSVTSEDA